MIGDEDSITAGEVGIEPIDSISDSSAPYSVLTAGNALVLEGQRPRPGTQGTHHVPPIR
ncbi:hypothetical protein [Candidatus Mycobacterium methanotrophicum]|uniref:Uncharacterized protein n=1 Tax=Candidatus Mycobacterium methanotrophicum TaxID=2943498 RepID=A0ABY4QH31_9MYCO|nr:hypothetical protein [Candidatus Mycobacterium methanotrophicum]UQX10317.1 hypothetical protein M5I08_19610 [Candidatus Mycobacterium methanotrophicum]